MGFPEATEALLALAEHENPAIASQAQDLLLGRMYGVFRPDQTGADKYLADHSWRDDLKVRAKQLGWRLLAQEDRDGRIHGARIITVLGGKDDLPRLIEVMDKLLPAYRNNEIEQREWLRPDTVSERLATAGAELIKRGARPPATPGTPGQAVAFLAGLKASKDFRPAGWQERVASLVKHDIPFLRALALEELPLPLSDADIELVAACLRDEYAPVQGTACDLAGGTKSARFRQPLTEVLRTATNDWILRDAFEATKRAGPTWTACWRSWSAGWNVTATRGICSC